MYVVRRAFRNNNCMIAPGSIIEPGVVKHFKARLRDRYIIEVSGQSLDNWDEYFKIKHGVSIKEQLNKANQVTETAKTAKAVPAAETAKTVVAKGSTETATAANVAKPVVAPVKVVAATK